MREPGYRTVYDELSKVTEAQEQVQLLFFIYWDTTHEDSSAFHVISRLQLLISVL
jgi:hypothetical protein